MNDKLLALRDKIAYLMPQQHFHAMSIGVIDFESQQWEGLNYFRGRFHQQKYFYDLASLTKPLTLALCFLVHPELWKIKQLAWLLNHRASFPIGGRLSASSWRESVNAYIPVLSPTDVYSDFSALRLQLEIEKELGQPLYEIVSKIWDGEVFSWLGPQMQKHRKLCLPTGYRGDRVICGEVHDDNAFVIGEKLAHAGLFGSLQGVCETLIKMDRDYSLLSHMRSVFEDGEGENRRFVRGWDTMSDSKTTLAGTGASEMTFGHLGFTGTSMWIDSQKRRGHVILTNGTQNYWYDKNGLNHLRRELGSIVWSN